MTCIKKSLEYIETNLHNFIGAEDVANNVCVSSFYLQKGFRIMTGYSISDYIRNRRLYLAALDICNGNDKIIDIAYKYGYETPESFTKAFSRFHNYTPHQVKTDANKIKVFLPLKIRIEIQGGEEMDFIVEKMESFTVVGFEKIFKFDTAHQEIPKFWDTFRQMYCAKPFKKEASFATLQKVVIDNCIGEFGVCIEIKDDHTSFRYLIAGLYRGKETPKELTVFTFEDVEWAKFKVVGPMPGAIQAVNAKIFQEWLPNNPDYEIALGANIEWYSSDKTQEANYESGIWIPVRKK